MNEWHGLNRQNKVMGNYYNKIKDNLIMFYYLQL